MDERPANFRNRPVWLLVLLALVGWQGWLTLHLFGSCDQPWERLLDDTPILSGKHPLHLYHGLLGAASLWERGSLSCFDPAFQAGYPKTPVFDSGSRPAELFLGLAGGGYQPAAYKIGLALCCCAVPLFLAWSARGIGLGPGSACLAAALGMLVWWGDPCRTLIEAGDFDILLAMLAAVLHAGLLLRFHFAPGPIVWLGLLVTGALGWFAQPLLFMILALPLLLVYYHGVGMRHHLGWHLALGVGLAAGLAVNSFWLLDWIEFWSLRVPFPSGSVLVTHRTLQRFWESPMWGGPADRLLAVVLLGCGLAGIVTCTACRERVTAKLLALGAGGLLTLALVGSAWEPLGRFDTPRLLVAALWFAILPAIHGWKSTYAWLARWTGAHWRAIPIAGLLLAGAGWLAQANLLVLADHVTTTPPLALGLRPDQQAVVDLLREHTEPDARILWEDHRGCVDASTWTALLPLWTGRSFIGGLDAGNNLEHMSAGLAEQQLAAQPLAEWRDADLAQFCDRYNLGWVVCRSPGTVARLEQWCRAGTAEPTAQLTIDGAPAWLFTLRRDHSFVLKGQARWLQADCGHIVLGDLVPDDGKVVLSLHYQAGMQVTPSTVQVEKDTDPVDPVPFIRLRLTGPVTRVVLKWEGS